MHVSTVPLTSLPDCIQQKEALCHKGCLGLQYNEVTVLDENAPDKCPVTTKLALETDPETKDTVLEVSKNLINKLKPHQVDGRSCQGSIGWQLFRYKHWILGAKCVEIDMSGGNCKLNKILWGRCTVSGRHLKHGIRFQFV